MDEKVLRDYLRRALSWHESHVDWIKAVSGIPEKKRGMRPKGRRPFAVGIARAHAHRDLGYLGILPGRKTRIARLAHGILAAKVGAAECRGMGQQRPGTRSRSGGHGKIGNQSEDGFVGADPSRLGPDDPARGIADRRSQRLPPGPARPRPAAAGLLAGKLSRTSRLTRQSRHPKIDTIKVTRRRSKGHALNEPGTSNRGIGSSKDAQERVWESFRRWGYLQANLDPLGDLEPLPMPELDLREQRPMQLAESIAAALALNSCTSRTASAACGCRSAWKLKPRNPIACESSIC